LSSCADRYLEPTLQASAANVIVVVGAHAAKANRWRYQLEPGKALFGPLHIGQRDRMLTLLPHPTGRAPRKKFSGCLSPEELHKLIIQDHGLPAAQKQRVAVLQEPRGSFAANGWHKTSHYTIDRNFA
jgi:hypothetical protein